MKKELDELSPNDKDKAEAIKTKAASKKEDAIARANSIIAEQREKIKQAKYDASHCDKDYSLEAVRKCKEKYKDLLSRCEQGKNPSLLIDENDKALFEKYKEELNDAKHAKITLGMQMIFQDPTASLNPRMTVRDIIAEGLKINGVRNKKRINDEVNKMLELVGLLPEHAQRYPHEFSGGQRQRIGIARALIMKPELIIADEPVSALDVSIQAQIINLLNNIREELGLTIIFIAHNLSVVKYFCDRIAVMYYGKIVELASSDELFAHPLHPYTISLLSAVPHPDPIHEKDRERIRYNPETDHDYSVQKPRMVEICKDHFVYCSEDEEKEYKAKLEAGYASKYAK
ncbi:MAG: ATP-binding cassette domain-containing protein [Bacilli bacterium]|nr:ATP-binding cassette domain-containing protein [Bacilli bacterium]